MAFCFLLQMSQSSLEVIFQTVIIVWKLFIDKPDLAVVPSNLITQERIDNVCHRFHNLLFLPCMISCADP